MARCARRGGELPAGESLCPECDPGGGPEPKRGMGKILSLCVLGALVLLCLLGTLWALQGTSGGIRTGKIKRGMAEVRSVATACQSFASDNGGFPLQEKLGPLKGIEKFLCPGYLQALPPLEGGQGGYLYVSAGSHLVKSVTGLPVRLGTDFAVIWPGLDGKLDPETEELLKPGPDGKARVWAARPHRSSGAQDDVAWVDDSYILAPFLEVPAASGPEPGGGNPAPEPEPEKGAASPAAPVSVPPAAPRPGQAYLNPRDGLEYVWVPPGSFVMGCVSGDDECFEDETPAHSVQVSRGFWMGRTEVTVAAFRRFTGATGYVTDAERKGGCSIWRGGGIWHSERASWRQPGYPPGDDLPVTCLSVWDAKAYCDWAGGRLPTEAEWEYAARAGGKGKYYWGGEMDGACAWSAENSSGAPHPVGQKKPNAWGLFDVLGNAWEICDDFWAEKAYAQAAPKDPPGPPAGPSFQRVMRGGSWASHPRGLRVSFRCAFDSPCSDRGFRCVLRAP